MVTVDSLGSASAEILIPHVGPIRLRCSAQAWIVDIGNEEAFDSFSKSKDRVTASFTQCITIWISGDFVRTCAAVQDCARVASP